jgi:hypothetical protein
MKTHVHLSELRADDLLLDRLAARADAGSEPVVVLLAALSRHAETPLRPARSVRRPRRHRALTAMAVVVLGASGVGAAAAVTQPGRIWPSRDSLRMTQLEAGAATAPSTPAPAPAARAGAPRAAAGGAYALIRDAADRIVLLPSGAAASRGPAASSPQAAKGAEAPVAAPGAAQLRADSVREAAEPHLSFFLATDSNSLEARKPRLDASPGKAKPGTPDDPAGGGTMTVATAAPEPAPAPRLSAGGGAAPGPVLPGGERRSAPATEPRDQAGSTGRRVPEAKPDTTPPVPSESPTAPWAPQSPAPGTSGASGTSSTDAEPSQERAATEAPPEAPPAEPVSSPSPE